MRPWRKGPGNGGQAGGSWGAFCNRRSLSLTLLEAALEQDLDPVEAQQDAEGRVGGVVQVRIGKLVFEQGLDAGQAEMEVVEMGFVGRQAACRTSRARSARER